MFYVIFDPIHNGPIIYNIHPKLLLSLTNIIRVTFTSSIQLLASELDPRWNNRELDDKFVEKLFTDINISGGYNPEYALKVRGPFPMHQEQMGEFDPSYTGPMKYFIRNGQHRFFAMQKYWDSKGTPEAERKLVCITYPAIMDSIQDLVVSLNTDDPKRSDPIQKRYEMVHKALAQEISQNATYEKTFYGKIFKSDTNMDTENTTWVDQLKKTLLFPIRSEFTVNRFKTIRGALTPVGKTKTYKGITPFNRVKYQNDNILRAAENENEKNTYICVGYQVRELAKNIAYNESSFMKTSYNSFFTILKDFASISIQQVKRLLEQYVAELEAAIEYEGDEENDLSKTSPFTIFSTNSRFLTTVKALPYFLDYLYEQIPTPNQLPDNYKDKGLSTPQDLTSAEIWHMFNTHMSNHEVIAALTKIATFNKKQIDQQIKLAFLGNEMQPIIEKWKALFLVSPTQVPPSSSQQGIHLLFEKNGCKFYNTCAFKWISLQQKEEKRYNLILGDIPVRLSSFFVFGSSV